MANMTTGRDVGGTPGARHKDHSNQPKAAPARIAGLAQGTIIRTMDGELPVEFLSVGDRVITRGGMRRIVALHAQEFTGEIVHIRPGVLGHDRPEDALVIGGDTDVLLRDWRASALYGAAEAMVPAARLVDGEFITRRPAHGLRLFTLCFERDEVIYADGVEIGAARVPVTV